MVMGRTKSLLHDFKEWFRRDLYEKKVENGDNVAIENRGQFANKLVMISLA